MTVEHPLLPPNLGLNLLNQAPPSPGFYFAELTTQNLVAPAAGNFFEFRVQYSARYFVGMVLYLSDLGYVKVTAIPDAQTVRVQNLDIATAAPISSGTPIQSAGRPPTVPAAPIPGTILDTLAATFTVPVGAGTATMTLTVGGWAQAGLQIFVPALGWFDITAVDPNDDKVLTVTVAEAAGAQVLLNATAAAASSALAGTPVYPSSTWRLTAGVGLAWAHARGFQASQLKLNADVPRTLNHVSQNIAYGTTAILGAALEWDGTKDEGVKVVPGAAVAFNPVFLAAPVVWVNYTLSGVPLGTETEKQLLGKLRLLPFGVTTAGFSVYFSFSGEDTDVDPTVVTTFAATTININWLALGAVDTQYLL